MVNAEIDNRVLNKPNTVLNNSVICLQNRDIYLESQFDYSKAVLFQETNIPADMINVANEESDPVPHSVILGSVMDDLEQVGFLSILYPEVNGLLNNLRNSRGEEAEIIKSQLKKFKVGNKEYLVISIEKVLEAALNNRWNLCKNNHHIYLYNGAYWSILDQQAFSKFLGKAAEKMGVPKIMARHYQFRDQLLKQFLAVAYLPKPEPSKDTVYINLRNGTYEITPQGSRLIPFDPTHFLTYQLNFEYNPDARAPIFQEYMDRVLPDKDLQMILAEYLGFIFIRHGSDTIKEEKTLLLYGTGANGKSVFFEIVNALLGRENVSSYSLQSLTNENGYYRANLADKLVNYSSEISGKLQSSIFKQMVSGEPIEARLPYHPPVIVTQYAKLIFNCNELPSDVEHSNAYFRRFLIIPFTVTIPEHEQDKRLHHKIIQSELAGVFNWVLEGLDRLLTQQRFTHSDAVNNARQHYEKQTDNVRVFLDEAGYTNSPTAYELIRDLYLQYREYCTEAGNRPINKSIFRQRMERAGIMTDRKDVGNVAYVAITEKSG